MFYVSTHSRRALEADESFIKLCSRHQEVRGAMELINSLCLRSKINWPCLLCVSPSLLPDRSVISKVASLPFVQFIRDVLIWQRGSSMLDWRFFSLGELMRRENSVHVFCRILAVHPYSPLLGASTSFREYLSESLLSFELCFLWESRCFFSHCWSHNITFQDVCHKSN